MIPHVRSPRIMHTPLASPVSRESVVTWLALTGSLANTGVTWTETRRIRGNTLIGTSSYPLPPA